MQKKYDRLRDTRQHLHNYTIVPTGASHKHLHKPIKEHRNRSCNFPVARRPTARPLRARASRLSSTCVSTTCTSRQRAPLDNSPRSSLRLHSALYERFLHTSAPQHILCHVRLALFSTQTCFLPVHTQNSHMRFSTHPLSTAPRSLLGVSHPCPPIGRTRHLSPCRSLLGKQADEDDAHLSLRDPRGRFGGTSHRATPRLHPSRGECGSHGARMMASAVGGVCRGGGVIASLVYERGV